MGLKEKSAIITGSTSGIGLAYARKLADAGVNVMLNGFGDPDEIEAARLDLERRSGGRALHDPADMAKPDQIAAMVARAEAAFGRVDIAISNAGIQHVSKIEDFRPEKWDAILAINLSSTFHLMRLVIPGMKRRGWGRILTTASAHSMVASPNKSAYVAAKHGIAGLTKAVALETAPHGITVNCISPGYVWTPLVENQIPDTMASRGLTREQVMNDVLLAAQPTKQFVQPEQVAALALFLCSDEAAAITGANYAMDGGWTAA